MRPRSRALCLVGLVLATGCDATAPAAGGGPADPLAEMRPDLIVAEPSSVSPGGVVELRFPEETPRGILFVLEARDGESWVHRFNLSSDGPGAPFQMAWYPLDAENVAFPDIGVGGPGPDRVPIPERAMPGDYRICTGNAGDEICTPIEIVAP